MSTLICNLPAQQVWVRKEYLRDHKDGHGDTDAYFYEEGKA